MMQINEKLSDQIRVEEPEASVITNYRIYVKGKNKYTQETILSHLVGNIKTEIECFTALSPSAEARLVK